VSRNGQTRVGALSNADNRALTMRQVLDRFTGEQSFATAMGLAGQQPLILALSGTSPANAVPKLFSVSPPVDLSDEVLVITDRNGQPVYARPAADLHGAASIPYAESEVLATTLDGSTCRLTHSDGACGVEILGGSLPVYSVAVPVVSEGTTVGVVAYVAPLGLQLARFGTIFQF